LFHIAMSADHLQGKKEVDPGGLLQLPGRTVLVKTVLGRIVEDLHVVIETTEVGSAEMVVTARVEPTIGELLPGRLRPEVSNVGMTGHVQDQDHGMLLPETLIPQGTLRPRGGKNRNGNNNALLRPPPRVKNKMAMVGKLSANVNNYLNVFLINYTMFVQSLSYINK
jgi:hypothetical protein